MHVFCKYSTLNHEILESSDQLGAPVFRIVIRKLCRNGSPPRFFVFFEHPKIRLPIRKKRAALINAHQCICHECLIKAYQSFTNLLHPATSVAAERDKHTQTDRNSGARHKIVEKNSPPAEANTSGEDEELAWRRCRSLLGTSHEALILIRIPTLLELLVVEPEQQQCFVLFLCFCDVVVAVTSLCSSCASCLSCGPRTEQAR